MRAACKESVGNMLVADWLTERHAPLQHLDRVGLFAAKLLSCQAYSLRVQSANLRITNLRAAMHEDNVLFHSCKIVRTPQCLHAMRIVHMHLKLKNTLLADSAHVSITDFDQSHDVSERRRPGSNDFITTPHYMAPKIGNQIEVTSKVDA
ncbi:Phototropin-1A [Taenia solium]|eukprot:TsM_000151300 transcript=TsM_000151300 gene=TsM_000151300